MLHHLEQAANRLQELRNKSQQKRGRFLGTAAATPLADWDEAFRTRVLRVLWMAHDDADLGKQNMQRNLCWKAIHNMPKLG